MVRPSAPFTAATLERLLRNPVYIGAVNWRGELRTREHKAIVEIAGMNSMSGLETFASQL